MEAEIKKTRKKIGLVTITISIFIAICIGCSSNSTAVSENTTISPTVIVTYTPLPTTVITNAPAVQYTQTGWPESSIERIDINPSYGNFEFSDDGESLIYQDSMNNWWRYSLLYKTSEKISFPEEYIISYNDVSTFLKKYEIHRDCEDLYFSPGGRQVICQERIYTEPTATVHLTDIPVEPPILDTSLRIYYYDLDKKTEVYLGEIYGYIGWVVWVPSSQTGVLNMAYFSPYPWNAEDSAYYFDVNKKSIKPLKQLDSAAGKARALAISADWIVYEKDKKYFAYHIRTGDTKNLDFSSAMLWGINNNEFLGVENDIGNSNCEILFYMDMQNLNKEVIKDRICSNNINYPRFKLSPKKEEFVFSMPVGVFILNIQ